MIDSNILIDLFSDNEKWAQWSRDRLTYLSRSTRLFINAIVYAEISIGFERIEELEECLSVLPLTVVEVPRAALFLAGKAFVSYKRNGGTRTSPLPDFLIGAHAAVAGWQVLTRVPGRMAYYFPTLRLIHP